MRDIQLIFLLIHLEFTVNKSSRHKQKTLCLGKPQNGGRKNYIKIIATCLRLLYVMPIKVNLYMLISNLSLSLHVEYKVKFLPSVIKNLDISQIPFEILINVLLDNFIAGYRRW